MSKQQMSASEIKLMLRKLEFPFCAREALTRVEQFFIFMSGNRPPNSKIMESAMEITAEFVFCEVDRRGTKKRQFSKIQELQLMEVLCDHFLLSGQSSAGGVLDSVRSHIFSALFPPTPSSPASPTPSPSPSNSGSRSTPTWEARLNLLCKLVSLAVATRNVPLLTTVGAWMAQAGGGVTASQSVRLAQCLVRDYIVLVPRSIPRLKDLPFLAPLFAAHFLAAISEMYANLERGSAFSPPPDTLLEMVTQWVGESAHLCLGPLVTPGGYPQRSSTPPSTSARVQMQPGQASPKTISAPQSSCSPPFAALFNAASSGENSKEGEPAMYSQLHLALLQAMLNLFLEQGGSSGNPPQSSSPKLQQQSRKQQTPPQPMILPQQPSAPPSSAEVISASHMRSIADEVEIHRRRICASISDGVLDEIDAEKDLVVQLALDRLGQALQVSLATGCLYGDRRELLERLSILPQNRLINIVISKHSPCQG